MAYFIRSGMEGLTEDDVFDEDDHDLFINFTSEVQKAIEEASMHLYVDF